MLTDYKVKALIYPHAEYRLGKAVPVLNEGSFYRVDGTHIFDKYKIVGQELVRDVLILTFKDGSEVKMLVEANENQ